MEVFGDTGMLAAQFDVGGVEGDEVSGLYFFTNGHVCDSLTLR